jgi:hypothetical protein
MAEINVAYELLRAGVQHERGGSRAAPPAAGVRAGRAVGRLARRGRRCRSGAAVRDGLRGAAGGGVKDATGTSIEARPGRPVMDHR